MVEAIVKKMHRVAIMITTEKQLREVIFYFDFCISNDGMSVFISCSWGKISNSFLQLLGSVCFLVHPQKRQKRKREIWFQFGKTFSYQTEESLTEKIKLHVSRVCHEMITVQSNKQVLTHTHALSRSHNNKKTITLPNTHAQTPTPSKSEIILAINIPFLIVGRAASRVDRLPVVAGHHVPRDVAHLRLLVLLLLLLYLAVVRAVPLGVRLRVRTAQLLVVRLMLGVVTVRVVITGCGGRSTVLLRTVRRRARRGVLAAARITRIFAIVRLAATPRTIALRPVATSRAVVLVLVASIVPIAPLVPVAVAIVWNAIELVTSRLYN